MFEHHLGKKISPSMRTTVFIALFSIAALLTPYLPIRRGSPPLLSGVALPPASKPLSPTTASRARATLGDDATSSEGDEWKSSNRSLGLKDVSDKPIRSPESPNPPHVSEGVSNKQVDDSHLDSGKDKNSEAPLETDTLDDLDSFLDAER